ncbi:hypothetical protein D3C71_1431700 [compost metagenome]
MMVSYHIFRPASVETPELLKLIFLTGYFDTMFPCEARPLIAISAKSMSKFNLRNFVCGLSCILTISASPFGLAVKYRILDPLDPLDTSYSLSRVTPTTEKRLM